MSLDVRNPRDRLEGGFINQGDQPDLDSADFLKADDSLSNGEGEPLLLDETIQIILDDTEFLVRASMIEQYQKIHGRPLIYEKRSPYYGISPHAKVAERNLGIGPFMRPKYPEAGVSPPLN